MKSKRILTIIFIILIVIVGILSIRLLQVKKTKDKEIKTNIVIPLVKKNDINIIISTGITKAAKGSHLEFIGNMYDSEINIVNLLK